MKSLRIIGLSYIWGIFLCNIIALGVWLHDPTSKTIDFPTILLTILFSLAWPVAIFGDFMASQTILRRSLDVLIAGSPFLLGLITESKFNKRSQRIATPDANSGRR